MNQKERDVQRKLRILKHAEDGGSAVKTCPYLERSHFLQSRMYVPKSVDI